MEQDNISAWRGLDRRGFLKHSGVGIGIAAGTVLAARMEAAENWPGTRRSLIRKNSVVLFQGDSITDAGRSREKADVANEQAGLGHGYAWFAGAELVVNRPNDGLKIY